MTRVLGNVFWVAKDEQAPADWEDGAGLDLARGLVAVADGASAAYRAREWACHLVESYLAEPPAPDADPQAALDWFEDVGQSWKPAADQADEVEWYHRDAARRGSFAAFAGAQLTAFDGGVSWSAVAVGDCCLLQIRDGQLVTAFPLSDPASFGNAPVLVPSAAQRLHLLRDQVRTAAGTALPGDMLLLSSDAMAKFMLTEEGRAGPLWPVLRSITDNGQFAELVRYLRQQTVLEVDDVTLLRVIVTTS